MSTNIRPKLTLRTTGKNTNDGERAKPITVQDKKHSPQRAQAEAMFQELTQTR